MEDSEGRRQAVRCAEGLDIALAYLGGTRWLWTHGERIGC